MGGFGEVGAGYAEGQMIQKKARSDPGALNPERLPSLDRNRVRRSSETLSFVGPGGTGRQAL
jgi:hypothetical protein